MTALDEAVASGQVSAGQIEAHRVAGDLPTPCLDASMGKHACANRAQCWEPCGELGHSAEHARAAGDLPLTRSQAPWLSTGAMETVVIAQKPQTLREAIDGATDENMHVWCKVSDVRAALDDAERLRGELANARKLICDVYGGHPFGGYWRQKIEQCTGNWFVFGVDRDAAIKATS